MKIKDVFENIENFLRDYANSTNDKNDDNFLSEGEWFEEFYFKMIDIRNQLEEIIELKNKTITNDQNFKEM